MEASPLLVAEVMLDEGSDWQQAVCQIVAPAHETFTVTDRGQELTIRVANHDRAITLRAYNPKRLYLSAHPEHGAFGALLLIALALHWNCPVFDQNATQVAVTPIDTASPWLNGTDQNAVMRVAAQLRLIPPKPKARRGITLMPEAFE